MLAAETAPERVNPSDAVLALAEGAAARPCTAAAMRQTNRVLVGRPGLELCDIAGGLCDHRPTDPAGGLLEEARGIIDPLMRDQRQSVANA